MSHFWLGAAAGATTVLCLVIVVVVAIRGAEHGTPMAAGHWPLDDQDDDVIEAEHRRLIETDGRA